MIEQDVILNNRLGLHARAAAKLVKVALGFKSDVRLIHQVSQRRVDAKSILSLMSLGAAQGTRLLCQVSGEDETEAWTAIKLLFEAKFGEPL